MPKDIASIFPVRSNWLLAFGRKVHGTIQRHVQQNQVSWFIRLDGNDQLDGRRFAYQTTLGEDGTGYDWGTNGQYYHRNSRFEGDFGIPNLTWKPYRKQMQVSNWASGI